MYLTVKTYLGFLAICEENTTSWSKLGSYLKYSKFFNFKFNFVYPSIRHNTNVFTHSGNSCPPRS